MNRFHHIGLNPSDLVFDPLDGNVHLVASAQEFEVVLAGNDAELLATVPPPFGSGEATTAEMAQYAMLRDPAGHVVILDLVSLPDGRSVYVASEQMLAGVPYRLIEDENRLVPLSSDRPAGEAPSGIFNGCMVQTADGEMPVEWLRPGDRVVTRDNGFQTLRRIQRHSIDLADMRAMPDLCPVLVTSGSVDGLYPLDEMLVGGGTRIMLRSPLAELHFGDNVVLARAAALVNGVSVQTVLPQRPMVLNQPVFDRPEVIFAGNGWMECDPPVQTDAAAPLQSRYMHLTDAEAALVHRPVRRFLPDAAIA